jgi:uncharacterized membrane protein
MTASQRYYFALMRFGDELFAKQDYCGAYEQYQNASAIKRWKHPRQQFRASLPAMLPATPTPEVIIATTEAPLPPTEAPTEVPTEAPTEAPPKNLNSWKPLHMDPGSHLLAAHAGNRHMDREPRSDQHPRPARLAPDLETGDQLSFISALQKRLEPLAWFCMGLLLVTGLFQLSTSPHYDGFLSLSTQWSLAILVKHGFAVVMVVVSAIQTWEVLPAIQRTLLKKEKADEAELAALATQGIAHLRVNLAALRLILGATALARVS